MNFALDAGLLAVVVAVFGMLLKSLSEMKRDIRETTTFVVETRKDLEHINYRLQIVEKLQRDMDDIQRYMTVNSDWQVRRNS